MAEDVVISGRGVSRIATAAPSCVPAHPPLQRHRNMRREDQGLTARRPGAPNKHLPPRPLQSPTQNTRRRSSRDDDLFPLEVDIERLDSGDGREGGTDGGDA